MISKQNGDLKMEFRIGCHKTSTTSGGGRGAGFIFLSALRLRSKQDLVRLYFFPSDQRDPSSHEILARPCSLELGFCDDS